VACQDARCSLSRFPQANSRHAFISIILDETNKRIWCRSLTSYRSVLGPVVYKLSTPALELGKIALPNLSLALLKWSPAPLSCIVSGEALKPTVATSLLSQLCLIEPLGLTNEYFNKKDAFIESPDLRHCNILCGSSGRLGSTIRRLTEIWRHTCRVVIRMTKPGPKFDAWLPKHKGSTI
jgi:hypothetical protein